MAATTTPSGGGGSGLVGHATIIGFGPAKRITVINDSKLNWTRCRFRQPGVR